MKNILSSHGAVISIFCLFIMIGLSPDVKATSIDPLDNWHPRSSTSTTWPMDVTYGNNLFVTVGGGGSILTSPDGAVWTARTSSYAGGLNGVIYGGGKFVAVGSSSITGTNSVPAALTSTDGINWTCRTLNGNGILWSVAYGNSKFVAVGYDGSANAVVYTSTDGSTWNRQTPAITGSFSGITYGNGEFVAVGNVTTQTPTTTTSMLVATSIDGITWSSETLSSGAGLTKITYGNGKFVAVGTASTQSGMILVSSDGTTWTQKPLAFALYGVSYGGGKYVATGPNGIVLTSFDGSAWNIKGSGVSSRLVGVACGNSTYVIVGSNTSTPNSDTILTSQDASTWTLQGSVPTDTLNGIAYGNSTFVAVGSSGFNSGVIFTSGDGVTWQRKSYENVYSFNNIVYLNGQFFALPYDNSVMVSRDGAAWSEMTIGEPGDYGFVFDLAYGNGRYVAVSYGLPGGVISTSADGINWTKKRADFTLSSVTYGSGIFVAVGTGMSSPSPVSVIMTSSDGINWTESVFGLSLNRVAYGNGIFVVSSSASASAPVILASSDGTDWTPVYAGTAASGLTYGNNTFVGVGGTNIIASPDGFTWTQRSTTATGSPSAVTYGMGTFVAVGGYGLILQSDPVVSLSRLSPDLMSRNFGTINAGALSTPQPFVLTNRGTSNLLIGNTAITGPNASQFVILQGNSCSGLTIPSSLACTAQVVFSPTSGGVKNAILAIPSNSGSSGIVTDNVTRITLAGTGQGSTAYVISGQVLDVATGQGLGGVVVTVKNSGNVAAATVNTDTYGFFEAILSATGDYTVEASKTGYLLYSAPEIINLSAATPAANSTILLYQPKVTLSVGWNFISLFRKPADTSIAAVMGDALSGVRIIWGYNNQTKQWVKYKPSGPAQENTLTAMDEGSGYWIYMDQQKVMVIAGQIPSKTIVLYDGWNLAAYHGAENREPGNALNSISGQWEIIWNWDNGSWYFKSYWSPVTVIPIPALAAMNQGRAYWVKVMEGQGPVNWVQP